MPGERLREDIDHGRMRDKVSFPDPAAAALGTDDEAAGAPVSNVGAPDPRPAETRAPADTNERARRYDGGLKRPQGIVKWMLPLGVLLAIIVVAVVGLSRT